jgi:RNA polymerase sigma-70 factor (ECF subfamily)
MSRAAVPYDRLLAMARRHARRPDEAEDLVQAACLAALASGRRDFGDDRVLAWMAGTLRNLGAMEARGAARRRRREGEFARRAGLAEPADWPLPDPAGLPPVLARTARLIAAGCTRDELRWLLGISDAALRQRLVSLRRLARPAILPPVLLPAVGGRRRAPLLAAMRRLPSAQLGTVDPDGHLLSISPSRFAGSRQQGAGLNEGDIPCSAPAGSETSSTGSRTSTGPKPSTATRSD